MEKVQVFKNEEFEVRTVEVDGEPWFIGKDIANVLGYSNSRKALADHVDSEDKNTVTIRDGIVGNPNQTIINESGLYSLVLGSKLTSAKRFKRWITSEVLPAIRQNGVYMTDDKAYDITHNPGSLADLLLKAGEQLKEKEIIIQEMKPKALFADAVTTSHTSILVGDLAKIIKQNGYEIGQKRLFEWLRQNGYLIKSGSSKNMPTQKSMDLHLFEVKESTVQNPDGSVRVTKTPKCTGEGQVYFINKFLKGTEDAEN
nr:MAG TPA: repressor domain protein [Caudoviricetes sp.]